MDSNTKLYVFAKFEIALIFVFMFFIAVSSFVFGIKIGESKRCGETGVTTEDQALIQDRSEMLSAKEEMVEEVVSELEKKENEYRDKNIKDINSKLKEEINRLETDDPNSSDPNSDSDGEERVQDEPINPPPVNDKYSGKYTIQLGAYKTMKEATQFAEGFRIRGYNPIISEADLKEKGLWYRVSLGVFDSASDAKNYIIKEKTLFQGEDYHFQKFD